MREHSHAAVAKREPSSLSPRPFVKWAGGKSQLLPELLPRLPKHYKRYFEPFLGGGALFFALSAKGAVLADVNEELVNVYLVIQERVEELIVSLSQHSHNEEYFYQVREADRSPEYASWSPVERASRFIFLNRTCYNGLYRVNSKGLFNVPFGDYANPTICDAENLRACSETLQGAKIRASSFLSIEEVAEPGDFVYFDPPYAPLTATSNFTSYAKHGFGAEDQEALRNLCDRLDKKGVFWMVSNSTAPLILGLYGRYQIERVQASRAINSKASKRGKIEEVIVRNYC